jgi:hypothetical protein
MLRVTVAEGDEIVDWVEARFARCGSEADVRWGRGGQCSREPRGAVRSGSAEGRGGVVEAHEVKRRSCLSFILFRSRDRDRDLCTV